MSLDLFYFDALRWYLCEFQRSSHKSKFNFLSMYLIKISMQFYCGQDPRSTFVWSKLRQLDSRVLRSQHALCQIFFHSLSILLCSHGGRHGSRATPFVKTPRPYVMSLCHATRQIGVGCAFWGKFTLRRQTSDGHRRRCYVPDRGACHIWTRQTVTSTKNTCFVKSWLFLKLFI